MNRQPDILVFMTDQQHHETVMGRPHLGRLMARGTHFTHAFCPTPICTPSRASVQTGLVPHRHKLMHNTHKQYHIVEELDSRLPTLGKLLSASGYATCYVGKWHVGNQLGPCAHGYREHLQPRCHISGWEGLEDVVRIPGEGRRAVISAATSQPADDHEAMRVADAVCERLERHDEEPLLLFASTTAPHVPWLCPASHAHRHDPAAIPMPASYDDDMRGRPGAYLRHQNLHNECRMPNRWPDVARALSHYHGIIDLIDEALGRILDCLARTGRLDNTLIVFCSDHGEMAGAHAMIGKGEFLLDDIVRTPLVIAPPGGSARHVADELVSLTDLYATLLAAAGSPVTPPDESRNLLPLLDGPAGFSDQICFEHNGSLFHNSLRAIRTRTHKYIFRPHDEDELYDLSADPGETLNRAKDPAYASILVDLQSRLLTWMEETDDMAATGARRLMTPPSHTRDLPHVNTPA